ncbi:MAG: flagellar filament capping protein FliD [Bacteroidetes bacterium]|nr:flagellar filament capping protein FliD [Rhodothermia bacterium]MCS7156089.1 flagellar filament capping protein FliD [Bacteroidota bacterium]MCX7907777.1 flagellar filament capping protein FliD [Bacteroidota bacterium]MDW8137906.1 flagellar filament capping protein FliD [Bacteroidota bacterium]MDW8286243.1 flagellar filament capping protein FliD [Bacteroidota bacterium]
MLINKLLNDPYEQLISKILQYESTPKNRLLEQKKRLEARKNALSEVQSRLAALKRQLEQLRDPQNVAFRAMTANASQPDKLRVSASEQAASGVYAIRIERLARADTRLSRPYAATGTELRAFFDALGEQTFYLELAHPDETDPERRVPIAVSIRAEGLDNRSILQEIAQAIRDALELAVSAGHLRSTERPTVSLVQEQPGTVRLMLSSPQTGYRYRLGFVDSSAGLLGELQLARNGQASSSMGGYLAEPGVDPSSSALNAAFSVNGLTFYRDANVVSDAIEGLTFTLLAPTAGEATVTVGSDTAAMRRTIEAFLKAYNEALASLRNQTAVDSNLKTRGPLAGDSLIAQLLRNLQEQTLEQIPGRYQRLSALGITRGRDGSLSITDGARLAQALERDPEAVGAFFSTLAARLENQVEGYWKSDGTLRQLQESADAQLSRTNKQLSDFDTRLKLRETQLRRQFAQLKEALSQAESQLLSLQAYAARFFRTP